MGELHCTLAWGSAGSVTEREGRWRERESNIITSLHPSYVAALRVVAGHYKDTTLKNM